MKNTFGNAVTLTLAGESHGEAIVVTLDGLAAGIAVEPKEIDEALARRRPSDATATARREPDRYRIVSGVFEGHTTGTPLCIVIPNEETHSADYKSLHGVARPSHADLAANCKYHGFEDYRGGGHFSGRVTVGLVAAGAILISALKAKGIHIDTRVLRVGGVSGDEEAMTAAILAAKRDGDSVGGVTETTVTGMPAGIGEPWFDSVEGLLSHAVFSLGGVKGIEFGGGFALADMRGSEANDPCCMENGRVMTLTNHSGGLGGGITNGMPIVFRCAVKPTPSIAKTQQTVNFAEGKNVELAIAGRHDPAIVRRICPVIDAVTALVLCDLLSARYGTDYLAN